MPIMHPCMSQLSVAKEWFKFYITMYESLCKPSHKTENEETAPLKLQTLLIVMPQALFIQSRTPKMSLSSDVEVIRSSEMQPIDMYNYSLTQQSPNKIATLTPVHSQITLAVPF